MQRSELTRFLNQYLSISEVDDYSVNGIQFEGADTVEKVVCAVDAGAETFTRAAREGAQYIVVHHGLFWKGLSPAVRGIMRARLDILYKYNMSLYACHLPLDRHPGIGNNAQLLSCIGAEKSAPFLFHKGNAISFIGSVTTPYDIASLRARLEKQLHTCTTTLEFGPPEIRTIAVASGGPGISGFFDALEHEVDAYITGEPAEIYHHAKDAGMHVIFAGHHATERPGIQRLAEIIQQKTGIDTCFIDIPTGL